MTGERRFLVLGAGGMLGRAWCELLASRRARFESRKRAELDVANAAELRGALEAFGGAAGDTVVNCAAWTDVDAAEADEEAANAVNGHAVGRLGALCQQRGLSLVHYSTDYVFAGDATVPYSVDAPIAPINAYGRSKALGERLLRDSGARHLLVRTSWVYAPWGKNFVRTMVQLGRLRPKLEVVDDQRGRPSSAQYLSERTLALLDSGAQGTFHVTDGGECVWYEFAKAIQARANPSCSVEPCSSAAFPRPAKRPSYSVLDLSRTEAEIGALSPWQVNLDAVVTELGHDPS